MTFKDILIEDNSEMLELDEFAELLRIDGVIVRAVVDNYTAKKSGNANLNFKGLMGDFLEIFFRTMDYCRKRERLPRYGEICFVYSPDWDAEKRFVVESSTDELGMAHLVLSAYRDYKIDVKAVQAARAGVLNDLY